MGSPTKIFSQVGIFVILCLKSTLSHIFECFKSCFGIFYRVKNWKNPENNFTDMNQFMKLVTEDVDDFEDDEPELLTDDNVQKLINESVSIDRKRPGYGQNDIYADDDDTETLNGDELDSEFTDHKGSSARILKGLDSPSKGFGASTSETNILSPQPSPEQPQKAQTPKTGLSEDHGSTDLLGSQNDGESDLLI